MGFYRGSLHRLRMSCREKSWEIHRKLFCQASLNRWSFQQHNICKTPVYPWMNFGLSNDTKGSTAQPCYLQLSYWYIVVYIVCSLQTSFMTFIIFLVIQRGEKYLQNQTKDGKPLVCPTIKSILQIWFTNFCLIQKLKLIFDKNFVWEKRNQATQVPYVNIVKQFSWI